MTIPPVNPFYLWLTGFGIGFHFREKLPPQVRKILGIIGILSLLGAGAVVGGFTGGFMAVAGSVAEPSSLSSPKDKWRSLTPLPLAPPPPVTRRLKVIEAEQDKEEHERVEQELMKLAPLGGLDLSLLNRTFEKAGTRKGPFCRVTCAFHHGGNADVEVLSDLCKANFIPKSMAWVPGWQTDHSGQYEYQNPWPGPANPDGGLDSYKLYWK